MSYFYIKNIWNTTNPFSFPQIISCKRDLKCKSQKFDIQDHIRTHIMTSDWKAHKDFGEWNISPKL